MDAAEIEKINNIPLNFVMGKARSGTTLLQVMLNAHPNIVAPPESRFIILLYRRYGNIKQWTESKIDSYCNDLFKEIIFRDHWKIDKEELKRSLLLAKDKLTYPLLCKMVFYQYAPRGKDIKMFIDKNPFYYLFTTEIHKIFPDATYMHIVRDYHANIESQKKIASLNPTTADMAYRWLRVNMLMEELKRREPEKWHTLTYEDLVTEPRACITKVCNFLHVPFYEEMILTHEKLYPSFYERQDSEKLKRFHEKLFQPINPSFKDSWKANMPEKDVAIAESIAGDYGEKMYGYKKYGSGKNDVSGLVMAEVKLKYVFLWKSFRAIIFNRWAYTNSYLWKILAKITGK